MDKYLGLLKAEAAEVRATSVYENQFLPQLLLFQCWYEHMQTGKEVAVLTSHFLHKYLVHGYKGVERWYSSVSNLSQWVHRNETHVFSMPCTNLYSDTIYTSLCLQVNLLEQDLIMLFTE